MILTEKDQEGENSIRSRLVDPRTEQDNRGSDHRKGDLDSPRHRLSYRVHLHDAVTLGRLLAEEQSDRHPTPDEGLDPLPYAAHMQFRGTHPSATIVLRHGTFAHPTRAHHLR